MKEIVGADGLGPEAHEMLGDILYEACQRGGYSWEILGRINWEWAEANTHPPQSAYYSEAVGEPTLKLTGSDITDEKDARILEGMFPNFALFVPARHSFIPRVSFLTRFMEKPDNQDLYRIRYREIAGYAEKGIIPRSKLKPLIERKNDLRDTLQLYGTYHRAALTEIRCILQAWYAETEYYITDAWRKGESTSSYSTLDAEIWNLRADASELWSALWTGMAVQDVLDWGFPPFYMVEEVPEEFIEAQENGILHYLKNRDAVRQEALPVHKEWWALMKILQRARIGLPVQGADEIDFEEELHGNCKHRQRKWAIVRRCRELKRSGDYSSRSAVAEAYSEEYYKEFGEQISPRTILRYWSKPFL